MGGGSKTRARDVVGALAVCLAAAALLVAFLSAPAALLYFVVTTALDAVYVTYDAGPLLLCCYLAAGYGCCRWLGRGRC